MELIAYLKIIVRYWWVILLATLVSAGVAAGISLTKAKSYSAQARVVARASSVISDTRILSDIAGQVGYSSVMNTFAQVFSSAEVRADALKASGMTAQQALDYPLEANVLPTSAVIEVSAKGRDPELLAKYVNATMDAAVAHGSDVYRVIELAPLERAAVPTIPTSPVPSRDIPIGAGLGLALGVLLAFATDYVRNPRRPEAQQPDVQIRPISPNVIVPLPRDPRDERMMVNGPQRPEYRQEYLVGRQQRPGSGSGTILPPGRHDDPYSG